MANQKRAARKDVAEKAGVSLATVTKILNNTPGFRCRKETRDNVTAIAADLGYGAAHAAKSLKTGKTHIIGLLLPTQDIQFHNRYYSEMVASLVGAADSSDYYFLYLGQNTPEKYEQAFRSNVLDGIIILQSSTDPSHLNTAAKYEKPIVTMNFLNDSGYPEVSMHYESGIDLSLDFFSGRHVGNPIFVSWEMDNQPVERFRQRMNERGGGKEYLLPLGSPDSTHIEHILALQPDGLIIDNDSTVRYLLPRLREKGIVPGRDIAVSIITDTPLDIEVEPGVHVIQSQPELVGKEAWNLMATMLSGNTDYIRKDIPFLLR